MNPSILILQAQVPFTRGGAEVLVDNLRRELILRNYTVDVVQIPFSAEPKTELLSQLEMWRTLELKQFAGRTVDLVIATKFPTYLVNHHRKVLWLVHQHRQVYELYGTRFGDFSSSAEDEALRQMIMDADRLGLSECQARYTISTNVSARLERYLGIESTPLPPPLPLAGQYVSREPKPYILSVGRLCSIKRVDLLLKSLPRINEQLKVRVVGIADEPATEEYLKSEISKHHLWHRVEFLGRVSDDQLLTLFADSFAVYYAPFDEDYGFVTLEALQSGKPVITASDSGSVLEFIEHEVNGLISEPTEQGIAASINRLFEDAALYQRLCSAALSGTSGDKSVAPAMNWDEIIFSLVEAPLRAQESERRGALR